jgi:tetratricopeptide (TPR) repeat protein
MERFSDQALSLNTVGMIARDQGNLVAARGHFERALELARKEFALPRPDPEFPRLNLAVIQDNLGATLLALDDVKGAMAHCTEAFALALAILGPTHEEMATFYNTLGRVALRHGDDARAESAFTRRMELVDRDGPPELQAEARFNLAQVRTRQKRHREARALLVEALRLEEGIPELEPGLHVTLNALAFACLEAGDVAAAIAHWRRALTLGQRNAPGDELLDLIRKALHQFAR